MTIKDQTAIVGVGQTAYAKGLEGSELSLACQDGEMQDHGEDNEEENVEQDAPDGPKAEAADEGIGAAVARRGCAAPAPRR